MVIISEWSNKGQDSGGYEKLNPKDYILKEESSGLGHGAERMKERD